MLLATSNQSDLFGRTHIVGKGGLWEGRLCSQMSFI